MEKYQQTDRVKRLFAASFDNPMHKKNMSYNKDGRQQLLYIRGWQEHSDKVTTSLRRAYAEAYVLQNMKPIIDPDELIVGAPDLTELTADEKIQLQQLSDVRKAMPRTNGRRGHMTLNWSKLLKIGVNGLINEIEQHRASLNLNDRDSLAKDAFYEGCLAELNAFLNLVSRYAEKARIMNRHDIATVLEKVPAYGATSFREALQSIHMYNFCLWDLYFYGRVDQFLLQYYENDINNNILTPEEAQELIDCFVILSSKYITPQSVQVMTLGGYDQFGKPVENALTWHFLQAISHAPIQIAQTALLVNKYTRDEVLSFAVDMLADGFSQPQIYNDDLIGQSMRNYGFTETESYYYANCGCVEIVPCDCSGIWPVSPYHNLVAYLLSAMKKNPTDFSELLDCFADIVKHEVRSKNRQEQMWQLERARVGCECLRVSCLVNNCLASGRSVDEGGAKYNHLQPNFLGLANVIDSLATIDILIYQNHEYTMEQFLEILEADYTGYEHLRREIINKLPHFGTNETYTDQLAKLVADILLASCQGLTGYRSRDPLIPGAFSYNEHAKHGAVTGASPDGRKSGYALAAGSSPVQGREIAGPTAALMSAAKWNQADFLGGVANNIMFSKKDLDDHGKKAMLSLIKTFMKMGGFQIQINVTDKEILKKAKQHPEQYRDLLVRVGGFNAYFVDCSEVLQQEIIDRDQHVL